VTYRDELAAAQTRADAAERENERLRARLAGVAEQRAPAIPLPEKFRVVETDDSLTVCWRWFDAAKHLWWLVFSVLGIGSLVAVYASAPYDLARWMLPLAHVAATMLVAYASLAALLNRTVVRVQGDVLEVVHGPIPWPGHHRIQRGDLDQIYVTRNENRSDSDALTVTYHLDAIDRSGRQIRLVKKLPEAAQARWLEVALERRLSILDERVAGELPRDVQSRRFSSGTSDEIGRRRRRPS
jgi:hypothetical protein